MSTATGTGIPLYDIELRSLGSTSPTRFASMLAERKILPAGQANQRVTGRLPVILARYVEPEEAEWVSTILKNAGGEAILKVSEVSCACCKIALSLREGAEFQGVGLAFPCWPCGGYSVLDRQSRTFRPMLICQHCRAPVILAEGAVPGEHPCKCGQKVRLSRVEIPSDKSTASQQSKRPMAVAGIGVAACLACGLGMYLLAPTRGATDPGDHPAVDSAALKDRVSRNFRRNTDRAGVLAVLGSPEKETATIDGSEKVLFYRRQDLCVVLTARDGGFYYSRTARLSDRRVIHEAS